MSSLSRRLGTLGTGLGLAFVAALPVTAQETDAGIVADAVRDRGFPCDDPATAAPDSSDSQPDERAWILRCKNASYRVKFIGSERRTEVEPLG